MENQSTETVSTVSANRNDTWNTNIQNVKTFAETNSRWPSTTSENPEEKALAQWFSRQKFLLNKGDMKDDRKAIISNLILSFSTLERDGIWESRYQQVLSYYKANNKLWESSSDNIEEVKMYRWWNQQKTFARKFKKNPNESSGGMTQERFDKVISAVKAMNPYDESDDSSPVADNVTPENATENA